MKVKYKFSSNISQKTIFIIKIIDGFLNWYGSFFKRKPTKVFNEITIVQLAHIGDLVLVLPAIKKLKMCKGYNIKLVVSSQNVAIANKIDFIDSVVVADAPYFLRGKKGSYLTFIKQLLSIKTDLIFDVRGDLRNNIFIRCFTKSSFFVGYEVGGGGGMLDVVLDYPAGQHITNLCGPLLDYLHIPAGDLANYWNKNDLPFQRVQGFEDDEDFLVVHLGTGAPARKWAIDNFITVIDSLAKVIKIYVLGTYADINPDGIEKLSKIPNVNLAIGKYTILESVYIVKKGTYFLGLDSGFTHIAALSGIKVFVLFSGMADVNVWKPFSLYKDQVHIINKLPPCSLISGCGKLTCEENICMKQISSSEVISLLMSKMDLHNNFNSNYIN